MRPALVTDVFLPDMREMDRASLDDLQDEAIAAILEVMLVPNELGRRCREAANRSRAQRH
jgi:hypothetical protein